MRLLDAHIGQQFHLSRAHLISRNGRALSADQIALAGALATSYSQASPLARSSSPGYWASIASSATTIRPVSTLVRR